MTVRVKYNDGKRECFLQVTGEDIEVDLLISSGIDIRQIPDEEYSQGFRAKENRRGGRMIAIIVCGVPIVLLWLWFFKQVGLFEDWWWKE